MRFRTTKEAAAAAGLEADQVYNMIRRGTIPRPKYRLGERLAWDEKEVDALIATVRAQPRERAEAEASEPPGEE